MLITPRFSYRQWQQNQRHHAVKGRMRIEGHSGGVVALLSMFQAFPHPVDPLAFSLPPQTSIPNRHGESASYTHRRVCRGSSVVDPDFTGHWPGHQLVVIIEIQVPPDQGVGTVDEPASKMCV